MKEDPNDNMIFDQLSFASKNDQKQHQKRKKGADHLIEYLN